jgi:hypothetical protein
MVVPTVSGAWTYVAAVLAWQRCFPVLGADGKTLADPAIASSAGLQVRMQDVRAVVIAIGESTAMRSLNECYPTPLLPLLDRPFIQHVVECLVDLGATEFDFILSHLPERVEQLLLT